jgi:hypothetical protein
MRRLNSFNRFQAFGIHFGVSAGIALLSAAVVFLLWYPNILAKASGVLSIFFILLIVDVILGPIITFIVFNPQKKKLKRDLSIVALIQILALVYGMYTLFIARPVYTVYNLAGFDLVYANEIKDENLHKASAEQFLTLPVLGPQVIAAQLPKDADKAADIMGGSLFGADDVQHLPQYYLPYDQKKAEVILNAKPIAELEQFNPEQKQEVQNLIERYAEKKIELVYLPLRTGIETSSVILNKSTGDVLEMRDLQTTSSFNPERRMDLNINDKK